MAGCVRRVGGRVVVGAGVIAVVVPVLGRPHLAGPLAENLAATTTTPYGLVFVCSYGDEAQIDACRDVTRGNSPADATIVVDWEAGHADFARKVNLAYRFTDEPWIFQAADDVTFTPGWDVALLETAERTGALVVGSNDDANPLVKAGQHATHSLIARSYIDDPGASMDGPGTVFSEAYGHQYVDNELVGLARARGVWAFSPESIVRHNHWVWGTAEKDDTYRKGDATSRDDARIFRQRSRSWTRVPSRV